MPTAVCSGRVMQPVAMTETCLFKLRACDMALSAGLHSHTPLTTPILINHTPPQTQLHRATFPTISLILKVGQKACSLSFPLLNLCCLNSDHSQPSSSLIPLTLYSISAPGAHQGSGYSGNSPWLQILRERYPKRNHHHLSDQASSISYSFIPGAVNKQMQSTPLGRSHADTRNENGPSRGSRWVL